MFRKLTISFVFIVAVISLQMARPAAQAPAAAAPAAATPESAAAFIGDWTITAEGANGPATFALSVKNTDGKVGAEISSEMQPLQAISDVTMNGTNLVLKYLFDYQGTPVPVVVTLKPADEKVGADLISPTASYQMAGTATKKTP